MKSIIFGILITTSSCAMQSEKNNNNINKIVLNDTVMSGVVGDSIIHITLKTGVRFNWNIKEKQIEEDSFYYYIKNNFYGLKENMVFQVMDSSKTSAVACNGEELVIGDLVFILLNKIVSIPNVIDMQLDLFEKNCQFPLGYFGAISRSRKKTKERIEDFLNK